MAKKESKRSQYERIVKDYGLQLSDCRILAFVFDDNDPFAPEKFHYLLMAEPEREYLVYDIFDNVVQLVMRADTDTEKITKKASLFGGQKTQPKLD